MAHANQQDKSPSILPSAEKELSFWDHLEELRVRIIKSVLGIVLGSIVFSFFVPRIYPFILRPIGRVVFISPAEAFITYLTLTILGGFVLAMPFIFFQAWRFVIDGLTIQEIRLVCFFFPLSVFLFFGGLLFAYAVVIPIAVHFFLSFSNDLVRPMITLSRYVTFWGTILLTFGAIFEWPLLMIFLTKVGIITPRFLIEKARYAIVFIFIVSAVLTPPDCLTQILMAIPLLLLYGIGILLCHIFYKK